MKVLASGLTLDEAKVLEQVLISAYTLKYLDNARREIAVKNLPRYRQYLGSVASIWEGVAEEALYELMGG